MEKKFKSFFKVARIERLLNEVVIEDVRGPLDVLVRPRVQRLLQTNYFILANGGRPLTQ